MTERRSRVVSARPALLRTLGRAGAGCAVVAALLASVPAASMSLWPAAIARVERGLAAAGEESRLAAVEELLRLPLASRVRLLPRALDDNSIAVRVLAAEAAGFTEPGSHVDRLAEWLTVEDSELRLAAARFFAATELGARAISQLGRALADSDAAVRQQVAVALGASGAPDATVALLGRMDDADLAVSLAVVSALGRLEDERALSALMTKLSDARVEVRRAATEAMAKIGGPGVGPFLSVALRDADADVRSGAIWGLQRWEQTASVPELVALLHQERDAQVRHQAVKALIAFGTQDALQAMLPILGGVDRDGARAVAIEALSEAAPEVGAALLPTLAAQGKPSELTQGLASALATAGTPGIVPVLDELLVRGAIARADAFGWFAEIGDSAALPRVLEGLSDPTVAIRLSAAVATRRLLLSGGPDGRAVEPVAAWLKTARLRDERLQAIEVLGFTGSSNALAPLLTQVPSDDIGVRVGVMDALARVMGQASSLGRQQQADDFTRAESLLVAALSDPDDAAFSAATRALAQHASLTAVDALLLAYRRAPRPRRLVVVDALGGAARELRDPHKLEELAVQATLARGGLFDAWVQAVAQLPGEPAARLLTALVVGRDAGARAKVAEGLAGVAAGRATLLALLEDAEPRVRANALWSLGHVGVADDQGRLRSELKAPSPALAANAMGAWVLLAQRHGLKDAEPLCDALGHDSAYARANALAGLRILSLDCQPGVIVPLLSDPSSAVAVQAAMLLVSRGGPEARGRLRRCSVRETDATVAAACRLRRDELPLAGEYSPLTLEVGDLDDGRRGDESSVAWVFSDGLRRVAIPDRLGRLWSPSAPGGESHVEPAPSDVGWFPYRRPLR